MVKSNVNKKNLNIFFDFLEKEKIKFYYIIFLQFIGSLLEAFGIALITYPRNYIRSRSNFFQTF